MSACDEGSSASEQSQVQQDVDLVDDEEEIEAQEEEADLVSPIALSSEAREQLLAQFDARGVDRRDINSCGEAGLLASIVGAKGRHFTFCGDGAVMQMLPPEVKQAYQFASEDLVAKIQEIAPESTQIPQSVISYNAASQIGGVANPVVAGFDYEPARISSSEYRNFCNDVRQDCAEVKSWAEISPLPYATNKSWCYNRNRPRNRSTRTLWKQIRPIDETLVTGIKGRSFVSACEGQSVRFRAQYKCPNGKWYTKYDKTVNEYEQVELAIGLATNTNRCDNPIDFRFKVRRGPFVSGGAYVVSLLTY